MGWHGALCSPAPSLSLQPRAVGSPLPCHPTPKLRVFSPKSFRWVQTPVPAGWRRAPAVAWAWWQGDPAPGGGRRDLESAGGEGRGDEDAELLDVPGAWAGGLSPGAAPGQLHPRWSPGRLLPARDGPGCPAAPVASVRAGHGGARAAFPVLCAEQPVRGSAQPFLRLPPAASSVALGAAAGRLPKPRGAGKQGVAGSAGSAQTHHPAPPLLPPSRSAASSSVLNPKPAQSRLPLRNLCRHLPSRGTGHRRPAVTHARSRSAV